MSDELLNHLGDVFIKHKLRELYGITFQQFAEGWNLGFWRQWK